MQTPQDFPSDPGPTAIGQGLSAYGEFWQIIRRRKGQILLLVLLGLACAAGYCFLSGPWYDSGAQLLVIKKRLETTPISGPDQERAQEDYLSTHILLILSRRVIQRAVVKGDLENLAQFQQKESFRKSLTNWATELVGGKSESQREDRVATEIINALSVTRDAARPGISPSHEILNLSLGGKVAPDCPVILQAIIDSYQDFLKETYRNTNAQTLELISQARDAAQKDLEAKETAYQKFLAQLPPLWKGPDRSTAQQDRLAKIDARLSALRLRKTEIEASIEIIDTALKSGRNPTGIVERMSGLPARRDPAANNPGLQGSMFVSRPDGTSLEEELISLQMQEAKLLGIRAPNHPEVRAVRAAIDNVRRLILPSASSQPASVGPPDRPLDLGRMKVELLTQELQDVKVAEQAMARLFEKEQQGASAASLLEVRDDTYRKGIERSRLLYESILHRLNEISSVKDFGGYTTQVIGPPRRGELVVKKYLLILGLGLFCGLLAGLGWASLAEASARGSRQGTALRAHGERDCV